MPENVIDLTPVADGATIHGHLPPPDVSDCLAEMIADHDERVAARLNRSNLWSRFAAAALTGAIGGVWHKPGPLAADAAAETADRMLEHYDRRFDPIPPPEVPEDTNPNPGR